MTFRAGKVLALDIAPEALNHDNVYLANQVLAALRLAEQQSDEFLAARTTPMVNAVEQMRGLFQ